MSARPVIIDEAERAKIVTLYSVHGLSVERLRARFHRGPKLITRILAEAGVQRVKTPRRLYPEAP